MVANEKVLKIIREAKEKKSTQLDLRNQNLTEIPEEVFELINLTQLNLSYNQLTTVPESFTNLSNLSAINLSYNQIKTLPKSIHKLSNLTALNLNHNQLINLPESISKLSNLNELYLTNNRLITLPESLGKLSNLALLFLTSNQLTTIPESLSKLSSSTLLYLRGNPLDTPPLEIAIRGIGAIREYFRQLIEEGEDYFYEAKLLIVGEGGAGKTTLTKKIENPDYPVPNLEKSTKGIDIVEWHFSTETGQDFRTNIWDFGGQEIYNATHKFFLTKRSLYILVADERKENTLFDYWLNIIELLSDNSPLLIIKNERDDRKREINITELKGRFGNIKDDFATNLATNRGLADILNAIKYHITCLPHIGSALPKTWTTVRSILERYPRLEENPRNYIFLQEYLDICEQNGFKKLEDKLQLSQFLHDIGVILHFQDDKRSLLYKTVILKPEWGTDAVYKVLDSKTVVNNFGTFTNTDLDEIWESEKYTNMQGELLELMMKFRLCYKLPETDNTYIAPQLLKDEQPDYKWDETNNLILRYTYDFMPRGILSQFIVIMHRYIEQQRYVWKSGLILKKGGSRAEIIESYDRREIKIRLSGTNQRDFLGNITWELDRIHDSYNRLKVQKLIPCNCKTCKNQQNPHFYSYEVLQRARGQRQSMIQCQKSFDMVNVISLIDEVFKSNGEATSMIRNKIFISYSHQDSDWLKRLQVYLKPLEKKGLVDRWDDTRIKAGMKWRDEIHKALDSAQIAILLVSSNFLASDFIDDVELPQLLKAAESEGALILSVILNPCKGIFSFSDLQQFQTVNPPSQPLSSMDKNGQDEIFNKLIERIVEVSSTDS
ncbi:MAG: COR domain-containing protein [Xenococcus sp. MO_188.B8]|nr:COR domain-containing protein [Xenococcus sp. MO_188.B8]